jgi:hypothetical protein
MRFRVIATLAVVVAAVGVLVGGVSNAAASTKTYEPYYNYAADPQTTNIPWVAWAGETVKVARCFGLGDSQVNSNTLGDFASRNGFDPLSVLQGEFDKSDWSGATDQPPFFQIGTGDETSRQVKAYWDPAGGICFATDVTSEKAGLERIKFSISLNLGKYLNFILGQDVIFQQDLYVIWMWDSVPTITESGDVGAYAVGDPAGSGTFDPIADSSGYKSLEPGLIEATARYWSRYGSGRHAEAFEVIRDQAASPEQSWMAQEAAALDRTVRENAPDEDAAAHLLEAGHGTT